MEETELMDKEMKRFKKKIGVNFPILKELSKDDLNKLRKEIIIDSCLKEGIAIECNIKPLEGQEGEDQNEQGWVYMIRQGMFQIKSETDRIITNLSESDLFGLTQLINNDVKVLSLPFNKTKFYRVRLEFFQELISKYPHLRKVIYSSAAYNYLKCCSYRLAKEKTKYFRRLRRISYFHINKMFQKGVVQVFTDDKDILHYMHNLGLSTLGMFILKGEVHLNHQNLYLARAKMLFNIEEEVSVREYFEDQGIARLDLENVGEKRTKKLDNDLYSQRQIKCADKGKETHKKVKIQAGNAVEIHGEYLNEVTIVSKELVVFVLETATAGFGEDNIHSKDVSKKGSVNKINRKKYM